MEAPTHEAEDDHDEAERCIMTLWGIYSLVEFEAGLRIFATKWFVRFARKEKIDDARLHEAVVRIERGSVDAELGGDLVKQRIAQPGRGASIER